VTAYLLDTVVFNRLIDDKLPPEFFKGSRLYITHIQRDELLRTPNVERRERLLKAVNVLNPNQVPTSSFLLGVSQLDAAILNDDGSIYDGMISRIRRLDSHDGKNPKFPNPEADALIAETAIKNGLTLVTLDQNLATVTMEFGGQVADLPEWKSRELSS